MRLLLVDGTNIVLRYAFAMLGERKNDPSTSDVDRVCMAVRFAVAEVAKIDSSTHAVICLDSPGPTWRHELFPAYKANRPPKSPDAADWSTLLRIELESFGWFCCRIEGHEADDLIATLAARAPCHACILSSDSDLAVLIDDMTLVRRPSSSERFPRLTIDDVVKRFKVCPRDLTYYKALVGEPGDNLPGVRGVGPVKALKLIAEYPTPDHLLESRALRSDQRIEFALALSLARLRTDAPVPPIVPSSCSVPQGGG